MAKGQAETESNALEMDREEFAQSHLVSLLQALVDAGSQRGPQTLLWIRGKRAGIPPMNAY